MADFMGNKKRLTINLSLFSSNDHQNCSSKSTSKSPKSFEPNGVVGLGILAAMSELDQKSNDPSFAAKPSRAAILAVSPKSTPIPIGTAVNFTSASAKFGGGGPNLGEEMELSEEYTCVISHVGNDMIKKREYFDDNLAIGFEKKTSYRLGENVFSASPQPPPRRRLDSDVPAAVSEAAFQTQGFLTYCDLCNKNLHGLDIFMYRGEKAFCSEECRCKQMMMDERKEKQERKEKVKRRGGSGAAKKPPPLDYSPCSSPMQFFVGVAAA